MIVSCRERTSTVAELERAIYADLIPSMSLCRAAALMYLTFSLINAIVK